MSASNCWHCGSGSQIERTQKVNRNGIVERTRACVRCGQTWTTAEVPAKRLKKLVEFERFLRRMKA